jgi:hypothetical protein
MNPTPTTNPLPETAPLSADAPAAPPDDPAQVAAEVLRLVCKRLRDWSKKELVGSRRDLAPLATWLEQTCAPDGDAAARRRCRRFARAVTSRLNAYRRAEWILFLAASGPAPEWDQQMAERPVLRVDTEALHGGLLRSPEPLTAADVLSVPARLAQQPEGKDGVKWLADSFSFAVDELLERGGAALAEDSPAADSQASLRDRCRNDALADAYFRLQERPPWEWKAALKLLLCHADGVWGWGCLTPTTWRRFYHIYPDLGEPLLARAEFEQTDAVITELHNWADGHEKAQTPDKTLQWLLGRCAELGRLAEKMKAVLAGPGAGAHRRWLGYLLDNFIRLGELAGYVREEAPPTEDEPAQAEQPRAPEAPAVAAAPEEEPGAPAAAGLAAFGEVPVPPPAATPPPAVVPETGEVPATPPAPPGPAVTGRKEAPEEPRPPAADKGTPAAPTPTAGEAEPAEDRPLAADPRFTDLVRKYPSVKVFDELVTLARKIRDTCAEEWAEGKDALESLRARHRQFRDRLGRALTAPAARDTDRLVRLALDALMDELIANLVRLDQVLPGEGEEGRLPPRGPVLLSPQVQAVRDRLFEFMARHGGYGRYPIEIGDSTTKHRGLRVHGLVPGRRVEQNCIARIVLPGYTRTREGGKQEVVRPPEVCLAK